MISAERQDTQTARRIAGERRRTIRELRHAAHAGEFSVSLQPRHRLECRSLVGAEASIRWPRRKLGLAPPGSLIPLLEQSGLMLQTTKWMLEASCLEALQWRAPEAARRGLPAEALVISLDIPSAMMAEGRLMGLIAETLSATGLPAGQLQIELAEGELEGSPESLLLTLGALRDLGVGAALDMFGSVSASLLTAKRLPFTSLKLDRSLTRDLPHDLEAAAALDAAIGFAHKLDMVVVALGVDTEEQHLALLDLGCDEGQGALFGGAMTPEAFRASLESGPGLSQLAAHGYAGGHDRDRDSHAGAGARA